MVLNIMECEGTPYAYGQWAAAAGPPLPSSVNPASIAPNPLNVLREGCHYFSTAILPDAPIQVWDRQAYYELRYAGLASEKWTYIGILAGTALAYRIACMVAWRVRWDRKKA